MKRTLDTLAAWALITTGAWAQSFGPERTEPLHAQPRAKSQAEVQRDGSLNEYFIYAYTAHDIPVVDDFSVDRSRHLNAQSTDAGVTLFETIYHLESGGLSSPDMVFSADPTIHYYSDTVGVDTIWQENNPTIEVVIFDLSTYPPTTDTLDIWPWYSVYDTIGDPTTDTLDLFNPPEYVQDSLLVYNVPADAGTYLNPNGETRPLILWEEDEAYVNGTYPIEPPTIGVASFDGMDRTGFPYQPETPNNEGEADHLTSVPINWPGGVSPEDSVYLSFFYQPQGRSGDDDVDAGDSLKLELYSPSQDQWFLEWSTPYTAMAPFKQAMVPITLQTFLQNGFRMRFSNRATLGGAVDHWHIDYVRLNKNRSYTDTLLQDVTWVYPASTLLAPFTSVPFNKFNADPALYMAPNIDLVQRNLYDTDALITWAGDVSTDCGSSGTIVGGSNIIGNANTTFTSTISVNDGSPNNFVYDLSGCAGAAFATVEMRTNATPDALRYNDTTRVTQEISNYYSYDDGSAEAGYFLNTTGGRIAYRFDTQGFDSLRAVRMYFDPIFTYGDIPNDPRDGSFLITVWNDLDNDPIFQNISFSEPEYRLWGPNHFVEYPLDSTISVGGTFYVGWTQTNPVKMNLGLDKNRVNNDRMFYNVGSGWQQSSIEGSWMLRPVMVSAVDPFAGLPEPAVAEMAMFPNPAADVVRLRFNGAVTATIEVMDATGRLISAERYRADGIISLSGLADGLYVVRAQDANGSTIAKQRLIVQRR